MPLNVLRIAKGLLFAHTAIRLGLSVKELVDPLLYSYPTSASDIVYMLKVVVLVQKMSSVKTTNFFPF
jgi:hypothetical protein